MQKVAEMARVQVQVPVPVQVPVHVQAHVQVREQARVRNQGVPIVVQVLLREQGPVHKFIHLVQV